MSSLSTGTVESRINLSYILLSPLLPLPASSITSFILLALCSAKATTTVTSKRTSCFGVRAFGPPSPPKKGGNWWRKKKVDESLRKLENCADDGG